MPVNRDPSLKLDLARLVDVLPDEVVTCVISFVLCFRKRSPELTGVLTASWVLEMDDVVAPLRFPQGRLQSLDLA